MKFNIETKTLKLYKYWYARFKLYDDPQKFINYCKDNYSLSTQRVIVASIKHFSEDKVSKKIIFPKGQSNWREILISENEYKTIMNNMVSENSYISERNRLLIKTLWFTGIRIGELLDIKWADIINGFLVIKGKGGKKRIIPIKEGMFNLDNQSEYIFSKLSGEKITYSAVIKIFKMVKKILGRNDVSPHAFRHSFATRLIKKDIPIHYISKLLGHSSLSTTERYLQWNMNEIKKTLEEKDWLC